MDLPVRLDDPTDLSDQQFRFCCVGTFPFIPVFTHDPTLRLAQERLADFQDPFLDCQLFSSPTQGNNYGITTVSPHYSASGEYHQIAVAVSCLDSPYPIAVIDIDTQLPSVILDQSDARGAVGGVCALECVNSQSPLLQPRIVTVLAAIEATHQTLLIQSATSGETIDNSSHIAGLSAYRMLAVPEWNDSLFVGGCHGNLFHFDLSRGTGHYDKSNRFHQGPDNPYIEGIASSLSLNLVFTTGRFGRLRLWDRRIGVNSSTDPQSVNLSAMCQTCHFDDETNLLILGLRTGLVETFDVRNMAHSLRSFRVQPPNLGFPDMARVSATRYISVTDAVHSKGNSVHVWDPTTGTVFKDETYVMPEAGQRIYRCALVGEEVRGLGRSIYDRVLALERENALLRAALSQMSQRLGSLEQQHKDREEEGDGE